MAGQAVMLGFLLWVAIPTYVGVLQVCWVGRTGYRP